MTVTTDKDDCGRWLIHFTQSFQLASSQFMLNLFFNKEV